MFRLAISTPGDARGSPKVSLTLQLIVLLLLLQVLSALDSPELLVSLGAEG
jgi:hypothetical protein